MLMLQILQVIQAVDPPGQICLEMETTLRFVQVP
jgi:hypothetical protein